ncbi:MAG: DUF6338 family protein [Tepidisphaeraceae bacterium]|jgi:hypothetical protein
MEYLAKDTITLLYFLLPGFLAAWVFFGLTAHPRREPFDRVIQALIFTVIIKALSFGVRKLWWIIWHPWHPFGLWDDEKDVVVSVLLAVALGIVFAVSANWDLAHWPLRKLKVTKRTSYPSEWYSGFHRFQREVILHLKGDRRLTGWADEWPDQSDRGHFIIQNPQWLDDFGNRVPMTQIMRTMVAARDVEMVEFVFQPEELEGKTLDGIKQAQQPLADMHKTKEVANERHTEQPTAAGTENGQVTKGDRVLNVQEPAAARS